MDMQTDSATPSDEDGELLATASAPSQLWRHRAGYLGAQSAFLLALLSSPTSLLRRVHSNSGRDWDPAALGLLLTVAALTVAAYLALQSSDPGFVSEANLEGGRQGIEDQLAHVRARDASGVDEAAEEGRTTLLCERERARRYRLKRIAQIQAALELEASAGYADADADALLLTESSSRADTGATIPQDAADGRRFCAECAILPPLRAHHCRSCGRCVATFDHHCALLGTCIGEKNHARFWWFLLLQSLESALALAIAHSSFEADAKPTQSWIHVNAGSLFLATSLWIVFLFVFGLWVFHTFLALTSSTTFEIGSMSDELAYLTGFGDCDLPFSRGAVRNVAAFCCPAEWCTRQQQRAGWRPTLWRTPQRFERDSARVCGNLWENKYYSCC